MNKFIHYNQALNLIFYIELKLIKHLLFMKLFIINNLLIFYLIKLLKYLEKIFILKLF